MAKNTRALRGKNLFAIDNAAIESTLSEANQTLLKERDKLLRAFEALPDALLSSDDIETAQDFARSVEDALSETKKARLADGRPFADASKIVKDFFQRIEGPLKATLDELQVRVTRAALSRQFGGASPAVSDEASDEPTSVIKSRAGAPAIAVVEGRSAPLTLEWVVEGVDRERLDLEKLRPFITDNALLIACQKHLEANGPHKLRGASYTQVAVL